MNYHNFAWDSHLDDLLELDNISFDSSGTIVQKEIDRPRIEISEQYLFVFDMSGSMKGIPLLKPDDIIDNSKSFKIISNNIISFEKHDLIFNGMPTMVNEVFFRFINRQQYQKNIKILITNSHVKYEMFKTFPRVIIVEIKSPTQYNLYLDKTSFLFVNVTNLQDKIKEFCQKNTFIPQS